MWRSCIAPVHRGSLASCYLEVDGVRRCRLFVFLGLYLYLLETYAFSVHSMGTHREYSSRDHTVDILPLSVIEVP